MLRGFFPRVAMLLLLILFPLGANGTERLVIGDFKKGADPSDVPQGWKLHERSGRADFSYVKEEGIHALRLRSRDTSFALQRKLRVDLKRFPLLSWKWKVTRLPEGGDFRDGERDDQAAQLFLAFANRKTIVYLWDSTAPKGLVGEAWSPPFMTIKAMVLRSGEEEAGRWITETRDVQKDYAALFGKAPPELAGIRIQINSQHTGTSGESYFADLIFHRP